MDKKLAIENVGTSYKIFGDLKHGHFSQAKKDIKKVEANLHYIKMEIDSGQAAREYREHKKK